MVAGGGIEPVRHYFSPFTGSFTDIGFGQCTVKAASQEGASGQGCNGIARVAFRDGTADRTRSLLAGPQ